MCKTRVAVLFFPLLLNSAACDEPLPTRVWTPADHGHAAVDPSGRTAGEPVVEEGEALGRAARALWTTSCAGCHGSDGSGQGEARPPGAQLPDFTLSAWQGGRSDLQLAKTIHEGRGLMPPFGKQINEHGIAALVQHIRGLGTGANQAAP